MHQLRHEQPSDQAEVGRLLTLGFSADHSRRNIWALRAGPQLVELCLVAEDVSNPGHLLGSIRYWPITIAGMPSVLLGPLAVDPELRGQGIGRQLVRESLALAEKGPWHWCFVSGERDYYPRLGFTKLSLSDVDLPAPIEEERLHLISVSGDSLSDMPPRPWKIRPVAAQPE